MQIKKKREILFTLKCLATGGGGPFAVNVGLVKYKGGSGADAGGSGWQAFHSEGVTR